MIRPNSLSSFFQAKIVMAHRYLWQCRTSETLCRRAPRNATVEGAPVACVFVRVTFQYNWCSFDPFLIWQSDLLSRWLIISRCHVSLLPEYECMTVVVACSNWSVTLLILWVRERCAIVVRQACTHTHFPDSAPELFFLLLSSYGCLGAL